MEESRGGIIWAVGRERPNCKGPHLSCILNIGAFIFYLLKPGSFLSSHGRKRLTRLLQAIPSITVSSADGDTGINAAKSRVRKQPPGGRTIPDSVAGTKKLIHSFLPSTIYSKSCWLQTDASRLGLSKDFAGDCTATFKELLPLQTTCGHQPCSLSFFLGGHQLLDDYSMGIYLK